MYTKNAPVKRKSILQGVEMSIGLYSRSLCCSEREVGRGFCPITTTVHTLCFLMTLQGLEKPRIPLLTHLELNPNFVNVVK
jgi:hypothetical protein